MQNKILFENSSKPSVMNRSVIYSLLSRSDAISVTILDIKNVLQLMKVLTITEELHPMILGKMSAIDIERKAREQ